MREENRLPWHYIVDLSRHAFHYSGFDGINDDFIASAAALYRRNYWTTTDFYVEVWAESRSIASVLQGECRRAGVDLYPASGFSSSTFVHDAAEEIVEAEKQNCVILYIGDYDPAGAHHRSGHREQNAEVSRCYGLARRSSLRPRRHVNS